MYEVRLDSKSLKLLELLQDDARRSIKDLSKVTGLTRSPVSARVRQLEHTVIGGYHAEVLPTELGLKFRAYVRVRVSAPKVKSALNAFELWAQRNPYVLECYAVAGSFDYIMLVVLPSSTDFEDFAAEAADIVPGIESMHAFMCMRQVTRKKVPVKHAPIFKGGDGTPPQRWWLADQSR